VTTDHSEPIKKVCRDLREIWADSDNDLGDGWPWVCRLLVLQSLAQRQIHPLGKLSASDQLDLIQAGDRGVGAHISALGPPLTPVPPRPLLEKCLGRLANTKTPVLVRPDALGRAHQIWHSDARGALYRRVLKDRKAKIAGRDLINATQLSTPPWIARYLIRHSLGASLVDTGMTIGRLTFLDPACGTGILLLEALDQLFQRFVAAATSKDPAEICEEILSSLTGLDIDNGALEVAEASLWMRAAELGRALPGGSARLISLRDGLHPQIDHERIIMDRSPELEPYRQQISTLIEGLTRLDQVGTLARPYPPLPPEARDLLVAALGRLGPAVEALTDRYDAVAANPPYLSNRQMGDELREYVKRRFPTTSADLYACFLARMEELTAPGGRAACVCPQSWTTLKAFSLFRRGWLERNTLTSLVSLGQRTFDEAGLLYIGLASWISTPPVREVRFLSSRLDDLPPVQRVERVLELSDPQTRGEVQRISQWTVTETLGGALTVHLPAPMLRLLDPSVTPNLGQIAKISAGIDSGENARFVRAVWEVDDVQGDRWKPYAKGQGFCRWFGASEALIDWEDGGAAVSAHPGSTIRNTDTFFLPGLEYSYVFGGRLSCRLLQPSIRDHGSGGIFVADRRNEPLVLALLNTRLATCLSRTLSPTLNLPIGCLERFPWPRGLTKDAGDRISRMAMACVELKRQLLQWSTETEKSPQSWPDLVREIQLRQLEIATRLHQLEAQIERAVFDAFELGDEEMQEVFSVTGTPPGLLPTARRGDKELQARACRIFSDHADPTMSHRSASPKIDGRLPPESFVELVASDLGVDVVSTHLLLSEGIRLRKWRSPGWERQLAERWVSSAVATLLDCSLRDDFAVALPPDLEPASVVPITEAAGEPSLITRMRAILAASFPQNLEAERHLSEALGQPLERWILRELFGFLCRRTHRRPILWQIQSRPATTHSTPAFACLVSFRQLDGRTLPLLRERYLEPLLRVSEDRDIAVTQELVNLDHGLKSLDDLPDRLEGVRICIAPLQRAGLLARPVLANDDVDRAIADYKERQAR
jgi:hypothetical protein